MLVEVFTKDTLGTLENMISLDGLTWNWNPDIGQSVRLQDAHRMPSFVSWFVVCQLHLTLPVSDHV